MVNFNIIAWSGTPAHWEGEFQGKAHGSDISIIFTNLSNAGEGPELHRHPYSETFIVRKGTASFIVGNETLEAGEGQIIVVGPNTPHGFKNAGPGALEMTDIHASGQFQTEWL